jgi:hypothetical protein
MLRRRRRGGSCRPPPYGGDARTRNLPRAIAAGALALLLGLPALAFGQELEPRAYSRSPVGTNFAVATYGRTEGDIVFDSSSVFSDVSARVDSAALGLGRVFGLAGRQASLALAVPYVLGDVSGNVGEDRREITRSGLGDPRLRFSAILVGGPAQTRSEFAGSARGPILGVSLVVVPPLGQYDSSRLINIGANRWAGRPEVGVSFPHGPWQFDLYAGVWLFGTNDDFYGGQRRTQENVASYQTHISYTFRPGLWVAANGTYYTGGVTTLDGVRSRDLQNNFRFGLTFSMALKGGHSLKLAYSDGATTRVGGDFRSVVVGWQYAWFD